MEGKGENNYSYQQVMFSHILGIRASIYIVVAWKTNAFIMRVPPFFPFLSFYVEHDAIQCGITF